MACHELDKVLFAEGNPITRRQTVDALRTAGYDVIEATDGTEALRAIYRQRPDLTVLAVDLAVHDGWQVLSRIREVSEMPVMLIGDTQTDRCAVRSLEAGADDFVGTTCSVAEVLARVEALLRRARYEASPAVTVSLGDVRLEIDLDTRTVRSDGVNLAVTPLEFRLLVTFLRHPDQVLSPEQLLQQAWEDGTCIGTERVKFAVARLRTKLTADGSPDPISAVRGFGYRFHPLSA